MKTRFQAFILFGLLMQLPVFATTTTLLNGVGSTTWYSGGSSANTYVTNGNTLVVSGLTGSALGGQGVATSFEPTNAELSLQVGEELTLSFSYYYASNSSADYGLGFGFYDAGASRLKTSGTGFNNGVFNSWTGYSAFGIFGQDTSGLGRFHINQRLTTANNLFTPFAASTLGDTHQTDGLQTGVLYTASLSLEYVSSTSMVLLATIGGDLLAVTNTPTITTFDTIAITDGAQPVGTLGIENVSVSLSPISNSASPVPEPSVWALGVAGMGMLGLIHWRRSRI